ncbi:cytochrome c family protein [Sneathiella sp. CAU 1612]|uniref:Cytochrome c family protein n=1 Tax=Sneathiella sedimenti TaxID=2816034 RepID=A0ABS3F9R4_9PROT|nr:cytochrome c family protein [Sneathiella sedimenti]MBO0335268.1 cytochrome c family protein [Sneathiella sedimenti]
MKTMRRATLGISLAVSLAATSALADGDAAKGEKVFKKCQACHTVEQGGKNKIGPNLYAIVGKKSASVEGYDYSKAMQEANLTWDDETLSEYLKKPKALVKGTKMSFAGLKKESDRENLIAYLKTFQ